MTGSPMSDRTEAVPCDACASPGADPLFQGSPPIVRCRGCGLVFLSPRLTAEALKELYDESYFHSTDSGVTGYDDYLADQDLILRTFHRRLGAIERLLSPGPGDRGRPPRLLDVGCATGFCLEAATCRSWEARGIEISEYAAGEARRRGLTVDVGEFLPRATKLESGSFDAITMWDYIEHVRAPGREIARVAELLAPGGIFALTTPDIGSLPARLFGRRWMGIKPEEHLYYFDSRSMRRYLGKCGLEPICIRHEGKYVSLGFFSQRVGFYSKLLERLIALPLKILRLEKASLYVNPRDIMIVLARKGH